MKNQFYLFILIASLAVCGTVMFRPQVADRVLGLLGLQNRTASPYVAPEWDSLTANTPQDDGVAAFGHGEDSDGFAVASPVSPRFSAFDLPGVEPFRPNGFANDAAIVPAAFDEGVAMSGTNGGVPVFPGDPAVPQSVPGVPNVPGSGFEAHAPGEMTIQFGGRGPVATPPPATQPFATPAFATPGNDFSAGTGFAQSQPVYPQVHNPVVNLNAVHNNIAGNSVSFADYEMPVPPVSDAGFAATGTSFSGNRPVTEASIVMPDPLFGNGFGEYRPPMSTAEMDARILPPAQAPAISWGEPANGNLPAGVIAQPFMTPGQQSAENAVVPVQGVVIPTQPVAYPVGTLQPMPQQTGPSQSPVPEAALYIPPQGNAVPQPMPPMQSLPQPIAPGLQQPVTIASATRHELPVSNSVSHPASNPVSHPVTDRRAQYEPEVITEIETVFATEMLARVGARNVILTCDILAELREILDNEWAVQYRKFCEDNKGQRPSLMDERNYKAEGAQALFEQTLNNAILLQMLYVDMTLTFPADRLEEIKKAEAKNFDMETLPKMMEQYGVTNRYDLDAELRRYGTTLERMKESTLQRRLAQGWFGEIVKQQKTMPTRDDMIAWYEAHKEEKYKVLGQAKWEELAILFSETANEQEAKAKIAELGNRVQRGEPFAEVAKQSSQGLTAYRGGERETTVGSLKTVNLEKAVFALPLNQMSTIITEETGGTNAGYYIIRVRERRDTHYIPFDQVQGEIQKAISHERFQKEQERVFGEIRKRVPVVKTQNLPQIIRMAAEAERNAPIVDLPGRHEKLIAKANRLDPVKKDRNDPQGQTAIATNTSAAGTSRQTGIPSPNTPPPKTPPPNEEPPKKKSMWQSLNPFK